MSKCFYTFAIAIIGAFASESVIADPGEHGGGDSGAPVSSSRSQPGLALPKSVPPQFGLAVIHEKGEIEVRYLESVPTWVTETKETLRKTGELLSVDTTTYRVCHHVPKPVATRRAAGEYQLFRNGKALDEKTLAELLKEPVRVVFVEVTVQEPPDDFFLRLLKDDTLVVAFQPLKKFAENAAPPAPPNDHGAPKEQATPAPSRPATGPDLDPNKLVMVIGPQSNPWNPVLTSCDGMLYFESNQKGNAGARSIAPARECCRLFEMNDGTLRLYGDLGEKGVGKASTKYGWYLTGDYSTNPPRVILAEKRTKNSRWIITHVAGEGTYIKNENDLRKDAWLSMEKEILQMKVDGADSQWLRRATMSFSEKEKLPYVVAPHDPDEK